MKAWHLSKVLTGEDGRVVPGEASGWQKGQESEASNCTCRIAQDIINPIEIFSNRIGPATSPLKKEITYFFMLKIKNKTSSKRMAVRPLVTLPQ
jgi:hypothetical protein